MVTTYAADNGQWETWQKEYRFGVLLIFPPDPPFAQVNALRTRYDPRSQSYCDAHISLTVPLPRALGEAEWRELGSVASGVEAFPVHYGPLKHYLPHPGVCLAIEPQAALDGLRARLEAASAFAGTPARRYPFSAHMTLAEFLTVEQTQSLMEELREVAPEGDFLCTHVSYAVPDGAFHFTERGRLELRC
jgi:2'-5' RNA ligase